MYEKYDVDVDLVMKNLANAWLITKVCKSDDKYYISNFKEAVRILSSRGKETTLGKQRPLK
jgi:hypothetical protein